MFEASLNNTPTQENRENKLLLLATGVCIALFCIAALACLSALLGVVRWDFNFAVTGFSLYIDIGMGLMAITLISVGSGDTFKLQAIKVATAVPKSPIFVLSLRGALRIRQAKGKAFQLHKVEPNLKHASIFLDAIENRSEEAIPND